MKGNKNTDKKEKKSYLRLGYIIPMVYCIFTAILMGMARAITKAPRVANEELARLVMQAAMISVLLSPSALIVCGSLSMKHRDKYILEPFIFSDAPLVLSIIVIGIQVLYLVSLTM